MLISAFSENMDLTVTSNDILLTASYLLLTGSNILSTGSNILLTGSYILLTGSYILFTGSYILFTGSNILFTGSNILFRITKIYHKSVPISHVLPFFWRVNHLRPAASDDLLARKMVKHEKWALIYDAYFGIGHLRYEVGEHVEYLTLVWKVWPFKQLKRGIA